MTDNTADSLRKHLDAVDRMERKLKLTSIFAGLITAFMYISFFYLAGKAALPLVLIFVVVTIGMHVSLGIVNVHRSMAQMTNTILKAIELSARDSQR